MPGTSRSLLECESVGDVTIARVKPQMLPGDETTEELFRQLGALIDEAGCRKIVLNLSAVQYLASMALGRLVALVARARAAQARLVLCQATPTVERTLEVTHLAEVLTIYADERAATQSFQGGPAQP
ncbi:MAG TPA: anti-sigma factor antagonist [Gemmataceae bacterium]|nr:anti-sigma factor antagonist [Gemmataceae bacterium]